MKTDEQILDGLIEEATKMVLSGVLLKNIQRSFVNRGLSQAISEKITRIAELKGNEETHYMAI